MSDYSQLPSAWEKVNLDQVGHVTAGNPAPQGENKFSDNGTPFVRVLDMGKLAGRVHLSETRDRLNDVGREGLKLFPKGSVLLTKSGASTLLNQRAILGQDSYVVSHISAVLANEATTPKWLYYFLRTVDAANLAHGGNMPSLPLRKIQAIELPLAPLMEQQRIVEKIETLFAQLDNGEEALREVQKLLTRYRQSVLKSAVTGQLTADWRAEREGELEDGDDLLSRLLIERRDNWTERGKHKEAPVADAENLPELPKEWVWATLAQITNLKGGVTVDRKREPKDPVTLPYLRVANVQNGYLDLEEIKEITVDREKAGQCLLQDGDILLNEGGDLDKLGRGWVWHSQIDPCIHQNHVFRGRPILPDISSEFVSYYANAFGQGFFMDKGKQSVNLASISLTAISGLPIPLPPASEQAEIVKRISAKLREIDGVRKWCETELKRSASLRQSILKDAFAGRLVPQDPTDEPASALLARIAEAKTTTKKTRRKVQA